MLKKIENNKINAAKDKFKLEFYLKLFSNFYQQLTILPKAKTVADLLNNSVNILANYMNIAAVCAFELSSLREINLDNQRFKKAELPDINNLNLQKLYNHNTTIINGEDSCLFLISLSKKSCPGACLCVEFETMNNCVKPVFSAFNPLTSQEKYAYPASWILDFNPLNCKDKFAKGLQESKTKKDACIQDFFNVCLKLLQSELNSRFELLTMRRKFSKIESLFENIIEALPSGILVLDEQCRILTLNRQFEFLFNVQRPFVSMLPYNDCLPESVSTFIFSMMSEFDGAKTIDKRFEYLEKPNLMLGVTASEIRINFDNLGKVFIFLFRDLSMTFELKKLQEEQQIRSEFLKLGAHALKSPLTALITGLQLIDRTKNAVPAKIRSVLSSLLKAVNSTKNLTIDFLEMLKFENDFCFSQKQKVSTKLLVNKIVNELPIKPEHILRMHIQPSLETIYINVQILEVIIKNLLENAVKYSPLGGLIKFSIMNNCEYLEISVEDEGLGINENEMSKIWNPFYRGKSDEISKIEGTGLGLSIIRFSVEKLNGQINATSELNSGSKFTVKIPHMS